MFLTLLPAVLRCGMAYTPVHLPTFQEILASNHVERHGFRRDSRGLIPLEHVIGGVAYCEVRRGGVDMARRIIPLALECFRASGDVRYLEALSRLHRTMSTSPRRTAVAFAKAWQELVR
jgi:hypothetical protein